MTDITNPDKPLDGLIALVTGATRGIGRASAIGLADAGAHVIAASRTQGALEALDDEIFDRTGQHATLVPLDITKGDDVDQLGGHIHQRWGRLDVMLHAAAQLGDMTPVSHLEPHVFDKVVQANLTAPFRLIRSLEPLFRQSRAARPIFVTSGIAKRPRAFWSLYASTKAGMDALVSSWADELETTAIRPVLLSPGPMRTKMRAQAFPGEDPMTLPEPSEIAPLVVQLARPDLSPAAYVDFRDWKAGRA
ncbi:MAG: SDR family NAD(P)-dependent oxidoreductase [Caulobacteraceae bacterium]